MYYCTVNGTLPPMRRLFSRFRRQQQQTRPLRGEDQLIFTPQTFLKFRFRVLFWRHSQTQLIGSLNDQIRSLPVPISSRQEHLRHWSQNGGGTEGGLPPAASRDRQSQRRGAFKSLLKDSENQPLNNTWLRAGNYSFLGFLKFF